MSRRPFARRYLTALIGYTVSGGTLAADRVPAGYTFRERYLAALTMTDLPGPRTRKFPGASPAARAGRPPSTDDLDILDSRLPWATWRPARDERFRLLAPIAAALVLVVAVIGLRLAVSHYEQTPQLIPSAVAADYGSTRLNAIAVNPCGTLVVAGESGGSIDLWSVTDGRLTLHSTVQSPGGAVNAIAFGPKGGLIASGGSGGSVDLWSVTGGRLILDSTMPTPGGAVDSVAFNPDNKVLAVGSSSGVIHLWNIAHSDHPHSFLEPLSGAHTTPGAGSFAFSPDGKIFVLGSDGDITLYNPSDPAASLRLRLSKPLDTSTVNSVAFSLDGKVLAAGDSGGSVDLWSVATGRPLGQRSTTTDATVNAIALSANGHLLAAADSAGVIDLWDKSGHLIGTYAGSGASASGVAFSHDGETLAAANSAGEIQLFTLPH